MAGIRIVLDRDCAACTERLMLVMCCLPSILRTSAVGACYLKVVTQPTQQDCKCIRAGSITSTVSVGRIIKACSMMKLEQRAGRDVLGSDVADACAARLHVPHADCTLCARPSGCCPAIDADLLCFTFETASDYPLCLHAGLPLTPLSSISHHGA